MDEFCPLVFAVDSLDENGYSNPIWWKYSEDALIWRNQNPTPISSTYSEKNCPRTDVSWYDAVAFCNWLSEIIHSKVRLPFVNEWEYCAVGEKKTNYPWGDQFHGEFANIYFYGSNSLGRTSTVGIFQQSISFCGAEDMIGNV